MITNYLADDTKTPAMQTLPAKTPQKEPVTMLIIGSPRAVTNTIHTLYRLNFAHISEWSTLQPTQNPGEVMSILIRQIILP